MESVCSECSHLIGVEITDGLWEPRCEEEMQSCGNPEGCWRFERREDNDWAEALPVLR